MHTVKEDLVLYVDALWVLAGVFCHSGSSNRVAWLLGGFSLYLMHFSGLSLVLKLNMILLFGMASCGWTNMGKSAERFEWASARSIVYGLLLPPIVCISCTWEGSLCNIWTLGLFEQLFSGSQLAFVVYKISWPILMSGRAFSLFLLSWAVFLCCLSLMSVSQMFYRISGRQVMLARNIGSCSSVIQDALRAW